MPGFDDTEAVAVYPTNPGDGFPVPTVATAMPQLIPAQARLSVC